jgi:hypothetical protein
VRRAVRRAKREARLLVGSRAEGAAVHAQRQQQRHLTQTCSRVRGDLRVGYVSCGLGACRRAVTRGSKTCKFCTRVSQEA